MCMPSVVPKIGVHDWYHDGSSFIVEQQNVNGYWSNPGEGSWYYYVGETEVTCFALLFLERAVPEISHSDLIVPNVVFSNSAPVQGDTVTITATVKNNDIRDVKDPFKVAFYDGNPDQGGQKIGVDKTIQSLNGLASAIVSVQWTIPTSEMHTVYVLADAYNEAEEKNENNNTGMAQITVQASRGYAITVAADKDSYAPGERVNGTISVRNIGTATANGTAEIAVRDTEGNLISSLSREYLADLAAGAAHNFTRTWTVPSGTAGGQCRLEASVYENDTKMASSYDSFQILNQYGVKPGISSDRLSYPANADAVLSSRVTSASDNFTYRDLKLAVSVISPDSTELMSNSYTVPELQPGRVDLQKINWNTSTCAPGQYTVRQRIYGNDNTTLLSSAECAFTVVSSLESGGFAGKISSNPRKVEGGSTFSISYEIRNTGNVDIADAELVKLVVSRASLQNVGTYAEPLTLQKGGTYQNHIDNIQTSGYSLQNYLLTLVLRKDGRDMTLAATYVITTDTIPPTITNLSPANGTFANSGKPLIRALLSDNFSGIADSSIVFSIDGVAFPTMYDNLTGLLSVQPNSPLQDGIHALYLTVKDLAGNSAATPEWKITTDANPPVIASFVPENGTMLKLSPPEISAVITDAISGVKARSIVTKIDSAPIASTYDGTTGKVILNSANLAEGLHIVEITAADNAGNSASTASFRFTVDSTAPVISDLSPVSGTFVNNSMPTLSAKLTDLISGINSTSIILTVDGAAATFAFDPVTGVLTANSPLLTDGLHSIVATASDNAGNHGTTSEWKITVDTVAPVISNISPAPGSVVTQASPSISAKLADTLSGIDPASVTLSIDGTAVPSAFDPATGAVTAVSGIPLTSGEHQLVLSASDNAGNSAATLGWMFTVTNAVPYAPLIFSNSGDRCSSLMLGGERHSIEGDMHGNGGICIEGCKQTVTGLVTAAGNVKVSGRDNNIHDIREHVPLKTMPVFDMEYYRRNADYHHPSGWNAGGSCRPLQPGIHFVNGDCRVGTLSSEAKITIVATGNIRVSSSCNSFSSADNANKILFFSGKSIYVEGSRNSLKGILYAPFGKCAVSGSCLQISGRLIANQVIISGCGTSVRNLECPADATPPEIQIIYPATGAATDDSNPQIKALLHDGDSGIDTAAILLKLDGMPLDFQFQTSTGCLTAVPQFQLSAGVHSIALSVSDNAGNQTSAPAWNFTILPKNWLLFHKSSCGQLKISGSGKTFSGRVHSNAAIKISGSNNDLPGRTTAVGSIAISGSGNDIPDRQANVPAQIMPVYDFNSYVARAAFTHNGDWHINNNDPIPAGIHYVNGNVKISGSNITGNVTISATGHIKVSGSGANFSNADPVNRILFFSKCGDIEISGNNARLKGILYAPLGACSISGSGENFQGAVIADSLDISGSNKNFGPLE